MVSVSVIEHYRGNAISTASCDFEYKRTVVIVMIMSRIVWTIHSSPVLTSRTIVNAPAYDVNAVRK